MATPYEGVWVYGPEDVRGRFLTDLGFELPGDLAEVTGAEFGGNLSDEHPDLLDVDVDRVARRRGPRRARRRATTHRSPSTKRVARCSSTASTRRWAAPRRS